MCLVWVGCISSSFHLVFANRSLHHGLPWSGLVCFGSLSLPLLSPHRVALEPPVIIMSSLPLSYHHTRRLVFLFHPLLYLSCRFFSPLAHHLLRLDPSACRSFSFLIASSCLESKPGLAQKPNAQPIHSLRASYSTLHTLQYMTGKQGPTQELKRGCAQLAV